MTCKSDYCRLLVAIFVGLDAVLETINVKVKAEANEIDYYAVKKNLAEILKQGYDPSVKPFQHQEDKHSFDVYLAVKLYSVMGIEEKEEAMTTSMLFTLVWRDDKIAWNPAEHHNLTDIYMRAGAVWKPVWFIPNAIDRESVIAFDDWVPIHYNHTGQALWQQMGTIKTSCDIDTTYFPFDKQTCSVSLHWYEFRIKTHIYDSNKHLEYYPGNGLWDLIDFHMTSQTSFPAFKVTYTLQRKPDFNILNVLFPVLLVALLGPLVFLLPAESGERIGYSVTVLLTISVYLTIVSESLPSSSSPMSLLTYVLFSLYVVCTLIVVVIVITTKLYLYGAASPVPRFLRAFIRVFGCRKLCKGYCMRVGKAVPIKLFRSKKSDKTTASNEGVTKQLSKHQEDAINANDSTDGDTDEEDNETQVIKPLSEVNWQDVAKALDRIALYGFYLLQIALILMYIVVFS